MTQKEILDRLNSIEAHAELIKQQVTVLRKELADSGASAGSPKRGLSETEKAKVLAKRHKTLLKNNTK